MDRLSLTGHSLVGCLVHISFVGFVDGEDMEGNVWCVCSLVGECMRSGYMEDFLRYVVGPVERL